VGSSVPQKSHPPDLAVHATSKSWLPQHVSSRNQTIDKIGLLEQTFSLFPYLDFISACLLSYRDGNHISLYGGGFQLCQDSLY